MVVNDLGDIVKLHWQNVPALISYENRAITIRKKSPCFGALCTQAKTRRVISPCYQAKSPVSRRFSLENHTIPIRLITRRINPDNFNPNCT